MKGTIYIILSITIHIASTKSSVYHESELNKSYGTRMKTQDNKLLLTENGESMKKVRYTVSLKFQPKSNEREACAGPEVCPMCWNPVLYSIITDFNYVVPTNDELENYFRQKQFLNTTIPNNSPHQTPVNVSFSKAKINKMQWKFAESQSFVARTLLSSHIPIPSPDPVSDKYINLDIPEGLDANQAISSEQETIYNGTKEIMLHPFETVNVTAYSKWIPETLTIPFTSQVEFVSPTMAACWICNDIGYICMEASLSGENILDILSREGFLGEIIEVRPTTVVSSLSGISTGSYGTETVFVVNRSA